LGTPPRSQCIPALDERHGRIAGVSSDLVRLAHETHTATGFEAAVLELLQQRVGFDVAYFSVRGAEASPTVVGLDAGVVETAVRGWSRYGAELLPVKRAALDARGVAVDTRVLGERGVQRSAYYQEVARSVGGRHSLMAYVPLRGKVIAGIMLGRCAGRCGSGPAFSDADIASMEALLPALGVARGSFGLPAVCEPLPLSAPSHLLGRLGSLWRPNVVATEQIGATSVQVRDRKGYREMVACENGQELVWTRASLRDPSESGWPYIELLHIAALQARARRRALFVGCGGAVALRQFANLYPGLAIDLVEREAQVVELARAWYGLDDIPGLTVHIADGASFAQHALASSWDIAVIDAFDASDTSDAPHALLHAPFFAALQRVLRPGGALAVNVIGTLDGHGPVHDVSACLMRLFRRVRVVPVMQADEAYAPSALRNVVLIASKGE
jgi:spermidine synthase